MKQALSKKVPFYFLGTILAPYDLEVIVLVIWHQAECQARLPLQMLSVQNV